MDTSSLQYINTQFASETDKQLEFDRQRRIQKSWEAYLGEMPKPLKVVENRPDDNVQLNFCKVIVDAGVSFLFGEDLKYDLDAESTQRNPEEEWLDEVWETNDMDTQLLNMATNGAITGQVFLRLSEPDSRFEYPRVTVLDPACVKAVWNDDDLQDVFRYEIEWNGTVPKYTLLNGETLTAPEELYILGQDAPSPTYGTPTEVIKVQMIPAVRRQVIQVKPTEKSWTICDEWAGTGGVGEMSYQLEGNSGWKKITETDWNYDFPPILTCQNLPVPNEFWGASDLTPDIIQLAQAIDRAMSNNNRILRIFSHPKLWTTGLNPTQQRQINIDPEGMIHFPGTNGVLNQLEMNSHLEGPLEFYKHLREALHEIARIPEVITGKTESIGAIAGVALKILYGPLVQKTKTKRRTYGRLVRDLNRRLLILGGKGAILRSKITLRWPEIVPVDSEAQARTATLQKNLGVSETTLMENMGFDPETEKTNAEEESQTALNRMAQMQLAMSSAGEADTSGQGDNSGDNSQSPPPPPPNTQESASVPE